MKKSPPCVLSRFIHIRGMRYRNCITEGQTRASLPGVQFSSLAVRFSTRVRRRKCVECTNYPLSLIIFRELCENCVLQKQRANRFRKQSRPSVTASAITPGGRNKKTAATKNRSAFPSRSTERELSRCGMKMPFKEARVAFSRSCITHL